MQDEEEDHLRQDSQDGQHHAAEHLPQVSPDTSAHTVDTIEALRRVVVFRFGEQQDLMFVLPRTGVHYFSLKSPFTRNQADLYRAFSNVRLLHDQLFRMRVT